MHNILFIHPDVKLTRLYQPILTRHFVSDSAHDGLSGLRKIRLSKPGVVISDYHLPFLSGLALLKFVRSHHQLAMTPFIFLSDHPGVNQALGSGASDWLIPRESSPELLLNKIYQHLHALHVN